MIADTYNNGRQSAALQFLARKECSFQPSRAGDLESGATNYKAATVESQQQGNPKNEMLKNVSGVLRSSTYRQPGFVYIC
jgi:hypothetical protein